MLFISSVVGILIKYYTFFTTHLIITHFEVIYIVGGFSVVIYAPYIDICIFGILTKCLNQFFYVHISFVLIKSAGIKGVKL